VVWVRPPLINLLLRFYSPDKGQIWVDGYPIDMVNIASLRQQIALVHQEPFLFSTTIRENILYGRPGASDEEVERAARAANIHDFITSLPQGYDTGVGQRGGSPLWGSAPVNRSGQGFPEGHSRTAAGRSNN
jgi:ABC-type multidrug transport system fused ATPase/permease subunit